MAEKVTTEFGEVDVNLESLVGVDTDNVTPNDELMNDDDAKKFFQDTKNDGNKLVDEMLEKGKNGIQKELDENGKEKEVTLTPQQEEHIDKKVKEFGDDLVNTQEPEDNEVRGIDIQSLIQKKILLGFQDKKEGEEYSPEEVEELIQANIAQRESDAQTNALKDFYASMPPSVQKILTYATNGATPVDMKNLYKQLSVAEEQQALDINDKNSQKEIIRRYLTATRWGDENEIEDEIASLADKNELEKRARQFKPKLDKLNEEEINKKLEEQNEISKQREQRNIEYINTTGKALSSQTLNGIPLDRGTASKLFHGLIENKFPLSNNNSGNMLSYFIDQYQWVKPNPELLAEALWLLSDPDDYRKRVAGVLEKEFTESHYRKLQTAEQSAARPSSPTERTSDTIKRRVVGTEQKNNFFGR